MAGQILVYGAKTCEDTAIARSRLQALGVGFRELDIDADPVALATVIELQGHRVTPTVVFGGGQAVVSEPSVETLDDLVRVYGPPIEPPGLREIHGTLADRSIPLRTLPRAAGGQFSLEAWRGGSAAAVFFAHGADCLACYGYAKQLARQAGPMEEADARPLVVVRDSPQAAREWATELQEGTLLLADPGGAWAGTVGPLFAVERDAVFLLVLDRYLAPRAISSASEAGGLVGPVAAIEWLRFLALECPECGNDVRWAD